MKEYPTMKEVIGKYNHQKWKEIEKERAAKAEKISLLSKAKTPFCYLLNQEVLNLISHLENERGFLLSLKLPKAYADKLAKKNINNEAYYSSHIEGAVTSLEAALLNLNKPKKRYEDESLQMIINNKNALEFIYKQKDKKLTHEIILKLQEILVFNTHKTRPITVGAYRKGPIYVVDGMGQVVYEGPSADSVREMMNKFINWINQENALHPLIKAALIHLYFVHIHPFDDGNGRSARALSNLYLANQNYQFINFLSPSNYFDHHRSEYYQSIRNAEFHHYDATYFIIYFLKALSKQLIEVKKEVGHEKKVKDIKNSLDEKKYLQLNSRQIKTINLMIKTPQVMTTQKYCKINKCSDETARKDFNLLIKLNLITSLGQGRSVKYTLV